MRCRKLLSTGEHRQEKVDVVGEVMTVMTAVSQSSPGSGGRSAISPLAPRTRPWPQIKRKNITATTMKDGKTVEKF